MTDRQDFADILRQRSEVEIAVDLNSRETVARDRFELSPILREQLPWTTPDVVVRPATIDQVRDVLSVAYETDMPVTPRGKGTGNYGQAVSFVGGAVMDLTRLKGILEVGSATVQVLAGTRILDIQRELGKLDRELSLIPSTVGSSIGGFLGGGSGGAGSMSDGWIWEGFVRRLWVMGCTAEVREAELSQKEVRGFLHHYGTSGVITRAELTTRPRPERDCTYAHFCSIEAAVRAGQSIFATGVVPWLVCVDSPRVSTLLHETDRHVSSDSFVLRIVADRADSERVARAIELSKGHLDASGPGAPTLVLSQSFNHVTERYLAAYPRYVHVQMSGPGIVHALAALEAEFGVADVHLDGFRINGAPAFVGLAFVPFEGQESVDRAISVLASVGVRVNSPHSWLVNKAEEEILERALEFDPKGLLNPGKLAGR